MSNTLTNVMHKILARSLTVLRETCLLPQLVNTGYSLDAKTKGNTVDVPSSVAATIYDVSGSQTPRTPTDHTQGLVQVTLDKWKGSNFHLTDQERTMINKDEHFIPGQMGECVRAIANQVNSDILSVYTGIYGYVGTAGTTPFSNSTDRTATKDATLIVAKLNDQLCPPSGRSAVLNTTAVAEALALPQFSHAEKAASSNVLDTATIGNKYNIDWFSENAIGSHTLGAAGTVLVDQADVAIGDTDVHFDGLTTKASVGDIFTVAGDTQTYTVLTASDLSTNDGDMTFAPAAKVAWANDAAVTFKATHVINLAFNREAIALATAPFEKDLNPNPSVFMRDKVTGLILRLEIVRQNKQTMWELDVLYGVKLVRPEFACRLAG